MIATARELFASRGYAGVTADDIVSAAGLTRGALHHHFGDKTGLFRAVFEELEQGFSEEVEAAMAGVPDTSSRMLVGLGTFLTICQRPEVLRIGLTDAPAVLGWDTWRAIEAKHGLGLMVDLIESAIAEGVLAPQPVSVLAQLILSLIIEAALLIAHAPDPAATRADVEQTLVTILSGLLTPG